ncbi:helix-turn-helix domain-containing protein [Myroides sp. LJL116]
MSKEQKILQEKLEALSKKNKLFQGRKTLDTQEVLQLLKVSPRTLQRYRSQGRLRYFTIGGKIYYKVQSVYRIIKQNIHRRTTTRNKKASQRRNRK